MDYCVRAGDCLGALCNEDTKTTNYTAYGDFAASNCEQTCTQAMLAPFSLSSWQCFFQSSCRQVYEYDACHESANYSCS